MLSPRGRGVAIGVIVALAGLVVLGARALVGYLLMLMIPSTKKRLFACWNNLHTIVSARGDYSSFQIVYALRRQSPLSNCVRTRTRFRLFLIESLCQKSLRGRAAVYFIKTIEKTDMRLGTSVKKRRYINLWNYINLRNSSAEGNAR